MKKAILVASIVCLMLVVIFTCGCTEQNATGNTATLVHGEKMFDFSAGQIITEEGTTEDIDVISGADDNEVRVKACNYTYSVNGIKISGDEEYLYYIDVPAGTECKLKDNEGGIATFTVTAISKDAEGGPTVTITWSYSSAS